MNIADDISFDDFDERNSPRDKTTGFDLIIERALSRREFMGRVISFGLGQFLLSTRSASAKNSHLNFTALEDTKMNNSFAFDAVVANGLDTVTVPDGFVASPVVKWGDSLFSGVSNFDETNPLTAEMQRQSFGDNNDGMSLFTHEGRLLLVVNNEYTNNRVFFHNRESGKAETEDDLQKNMAAHGVSICEIDFIDGAWRLISDSPFNRRITAMTEMEIAGPAAGHDLLKTRDDPAGLSVLGTFNNCGNGVTPWGTYLSCEENFNGYFSSSDPDFDVTPEFARYGIGVKGWGYDWNKIEERFDISLEPNEANRFGYVVEIDPKDPARAIKKRTALGRFKHENAEVVVAENGHVVVYMGDDERGEFLYKYVSDGTYVEGESTSQLLNKGVLYVAKFYDDLRGAWLPLTPETTGMPLAEICIHTRLAASKVGATTMDRPEWVAVHPDRAECYCALTNNKQRGVKPNKGGDEQTVGGPNPRAKNVYGQILKWQPDKGDHTASGFQWSLFALAGNPQKHSDEKAGSRNINSGNMFNAPDGLSFDSKGRLWIQTDGNYTDSGDFEGMGNNQMLVGDTQTGEIRRFLVGPRECEVTGICWSPDKATLFVGIQHPGEKGGSHYPLMGEHLPRSAVVAVRREDGQPFG